MEDPVLTIPAGPLTSGEAVTISYSGGDPNSTITVNIDDGGNPKQTDSVNIQLNANGDGQVEWTVKAWDLARFNAPDVPEEQRLIVPPPG